MAMESSLSICALMSSGVIAAAPGAKRHRPVGGSPVEATGDFLASRLAVQGEYGPGLRVSIAALRGKLNR
jgi:hypothetical protein